MSFGQILLLGLVLAIIPWGLYCYRAARRRGQILAEHHADHAARLEHFPEDIQRQVHADDVRMTRHAAELMLGLAFLAGITAIVIWQINPAQALSRWFLVSSAVLWSLVVSGNAVRLLVSWVDRERARDPVVSDLGVAPVMDFWRPYWTLVILGIVVLVATFKFLAEGTITPEAIVAVVLAITVVIGFVTPRERRLLTGRGVVTASGSTRWDQFRGVVWSDDAQTIALHRLPGWFRTAWVLLPVPPQQREEIEAMLDEFGPKITAA